MSEKFYITTPIYYPSDKLHIGHAYATVNTDAIARYNRLLGKDVWFLTGADEHGQKIQRKAEEKGVTPQEYVDEVVSGIQDLWKLMNISNDDFIRTTEKRHSDAVMKIFKQLYDKGDIYKSEYEGLYCTPCESFWLERQLKDGCCPDCGRKVEKAKEESYFLRTSKYADRLIKYIEDNPDFIEPSSRAKEMMTNFLKPGLEDLCVSRTSFSWGIPVDFDPKHVIYVWLDALTNYITALGYGSDDDSMYQKFWPADVHIVGKEIIRFHTIYWPIMLMALDLPLPKKIYGHGWLTIDGGKMSKSKGNVVDPKVLVERYGVDAIRYFLLREVHFGGDGEFTNEALLSRINFDLANDLGNLLSRTVSMIEKYFDGIIPYSKETTEFDSEIEESFGQLKMDVTELMDNYKVNEALTEIFRMISMCNKYIDQTAPWVLAKDESKNKVLADVLYHLAESLRIISIYLTPFLPDTAVEIRRQLGIGEQWNMFKDVDFGAEIMGAKVEKGDALFPRIDIPKELESLEALRPKNVKAPKEEKTEKKEKPAKPEITIDDFAKLDLRLGKILECEPVKKSDRLYKLQVKIGEETRQIVSSIREFFSPDELVGKTVVVVYNLKSVKFRGEMSCGMLLAASDEDETTLSLITTDKDMEDGLGVH